VVEQKQDSDAPIDLGGDIQGLQQLTQTTAKGVGTRPIAEEFIKQLDLHESAEDFLEDFSVEQLSGVSPFGFIPGLEESEVKKGDV
jgi:hypothetical protein